MATANNNNNNNDQNYESPYSPVSPLDADQETLVDPFATPNASVFSLPESFAPTLYEETSPTLSLYFHAPIIHTGSISSAKYYLPIRFSADTNPTMIVRAIREDAVSAEESDEVFRCTKEGGRGAYVVQSGVDGRGAGADGQSLLPQGGRIKFGFLGKGFKMELFAKTEGGEKRVLRYDGVEKWYLTGQDGVEVVVARVVKLKAELRFEKEWYVKKEVRDAVIFAWCMVLRKEGRKTKSGLILGVMAYGVGAVVPGPIIRTAQRGKIPV